MRTATANENPSGLGIGNPEFRRRFAFLLHFGLVHQSDRSHKLHVVGAVHVRRAPEFVFIFVESVVDFADRALAGNNVRSVLFYDDNVRYHHCSERDVGYFTGTLI